MEKKETINILLIEDDAEFADMTRSNIKDGITTYNCNFKIVDKGELALEEFEANPNYDIVISDEVLKIGNLTGSKTISEIKEKYPFVQAILCSGYDRTPGEIGQIIDAGIHHYFPKPVEWSQITQTIPTLYELKKQQEKFRLTKEERDWLQKIIESIPDQVAIIERGTYKVIFANKANRNKHSDNIIGIPCYKVFKEYEKKCCGTEKCLADEAWKKGQTVRTEFSEFQENIGSNREKFYIEETVTPLKDITGNYNFAISIGRDITNQKILSDTNEKLQNVKYNEVMSLGSRYEKEIIDILLQGIKELGIDRARFYLVNKDLGIVENIACTESFPGGYEKLKIPIDQDIENFIDVDESFYRIYGENDLKTQLDIDWKNAPNSCTVKLMAEKELIGLIGMDNYKSGKPITAEGFDYLRNLLRYVGLAIKSIRETHNYESIKKIGSEINRNLSKIDLYQTIVKSICRYFNTEMCTIFVYNTVNDSLEKGAICVRKVDENGQIQFRTDIGDFPEIYRSGTFLAGSVFSECKTLCVNDIHVNDQKNQEVVKKYEGILDSTRIQNAIFSTLVINNKPVGLLRCGNKLDYEGKILETGFRNDETDSFKFIGNFVADVLSNRQFLEKMNLISEMSRFIHEEETSEIDCTLFLILTCITMMRGLGFNRAVLFLKDEKNDDKLIVKRAVGPFDSEADGKIREDPVWQDLTKIGLKEILNKFKKAFKAKEEVSFFKNPDIDKKEYYLSERFNDICKELSYSIVNDRNIITETFNNQKNTIPTEQDEFLREIGIAGKCTNCYYSVPLICSDRNIGVIYVDNRFNGKSIDPSNIELLRNFSNHISIVIEMVREYQLAEKINEIIADITNKVNLEQVFGTIQQEIKKLYKISDVCVMLESEQKSASSSLRRCDLKKDKVKNEIDTESYCIHCNKEIFEKIKTKYPKILNLKTREEIIDFHPGYTGNAKSRIISPIIFEDKIIGILDIYSNEEKQFTEFEEQLFINLSSQIAMVNKIKQSEKEKRQYIIDLTHEVKTKIQIVMGIIGNIEMGIKKPNEIKETSTNIQNTLKLLANEILEIESSVVSGEGVSCSFQKEGIYQCIFDAWQLVKQSPIKVNWEEIKNLPDISLDRKLVTHLFTNLFTNAEHYSTDLSEFPIEVRTRVCEDQIIFEVINYGIQIHDTKKIFDVSYREEEAIKKRITGTGIGLNFVKRIIEKHKGQIKAESSEFKEGIFKNVFTLNFLIAKGEEHG